MANNWQYATLRDKDRLSAIEGGNVEMYNSEKERNKLLKKQQLKLGISTKDVDAWDENVDNAYNTYLKNKKRATIPNFTGKYASLNKQLNSTIAKLRKERDESIESAKADAESSLRFLEEWLANNGYSDKGRLSLESKEKLESALESLLKSIGEEYEKQIKSTRSKFLSMVK